MIVKSIGIALLIGVFAFVVQYFGQTDSCLDQGGCWDEVAGQCRKQEPHAQALCDQNKLETCGINQNCAAGFECIQIKDIKSPRCVKSEEICAYACGSFDCNLMESYPLQVSCN